MKIERFEDIDAWKPSRELTNIIYALTGETRACIKGLINYLKRYATEAK